MYKVIFVDDEKYILDRVKTAIDWNEHGFELVKTFSRSEHIFDYISENPVDAIITDIRMPNFSGLDIAKFCAENFPDVAVIVLSAYREFEYAQEAIKCNVFDYLTKPLSYNDIDICLNKLKKHLDSSTSSQFSGNSAEKLVIRQTFFDIVYGIITSENELKNKLLENGISVDIKKDACKIITVRIENYANYINKSWKHPLERLYNAIDSFITFENRDFTAVYLRNFLNYVEIFVIKKSECESFDECIKAFMHSFGKNLKENLNITCEIKATEEYASLSMLMNEKRSKKEDESDFENEIICKANDYIKEHYKESVTLRDAANYVNLSYKYFGNYFKSHTGYNFLNYLNLYRLKKAVEFMTDASLTINAICDITGFSNQTYFYNLFKNYYNMSPNEYRKELLKKNSHKKDE